MKYTKRILSAIPPVLYIFLILTTVQCNDSTDDLVIEPNYEDFDLGTASLQFRNHCGGCHGQNLESFVERDWKYENSLEGIANSVKVGYPENGMPSYEPTFSEFELMSLAAYILKETDGKTKASLVADNPELSGVIETEDLSFRVETISDEIEGVPWAIQQLPDGDFLVTERGGELYILSPEGELNSISGIPQVETANQAGLLDVAIHPDFENNSYVYISYSKVNPEISFESTTAVVRGTLVGSALQNVEEIFLALPYAAGVYHYGSRLLFDKLGFLYVSVGDRAYRDVYPQALDNQLGKVHRIHNDGSIPSDNPFVNNDDAYNSIFSYGIRNPQGLSLHPETGQVWEGEHGPQGGDEINILNSGSNYGWPVISYGINYDGTSFTDLTEMEGMEQPVNYWVPSIAPSGMDFNSGDFYGNWKNDLFVGSLKFEYLHRLKMNGDVVIGHEKLLENIGRVRDVHMGNDGFLYVAVEGPGRVLRLVPEQ